MNVLVKIESPGLGPVRLDHVGTRIPTATIDPDHRRHACRHSKLLQRRQPDAARGRCLSPRMSLVSAARLTAPGSRCDLGIHKGLQRQARYTVRCEGAVKMKQYVSERDDESEDRGADRASDLLAIVRIGEGIRGVVDIARDVNLAALNAMLSSRQSGEKALGFRVATAELRGVSTRLADAMQGLTLLVSGMVRDVAMRQHKQRTRAYYRRIEDRARHVPEILGEISNRQESEIIRLGGMLGKHRRELGLRTDKAMRLCDQGLALSRSALIEAAYGGDAAPALRQVAEQLTHSIRAVADTLGKVQAELGEMRVGEMRVGAGA